MSKLRFLTIAVTGLLILNVGILAYIFIGPGAPGNAGGWEEPKYRIIRALQFDDAQQAQYQVLIADHQKQMHRLRGEARTLRDSLYALLKKDPPDTLTMTHLIAEIAANQQQIEEVNMDHFHKIRLLCRPDQINAFDALTADLTRIFAPIDPKQHGRH